MASSQRGFTATGSGFLNQLETVIERSATKLDRDWGDVRVGAVAPLKRRRLKVAIQTEVATVVDEAIRQLEISLSDVNYANKRAATEAIRQLKSERISIAADLLRGGTVDLARRFVRKLIDALFAILLGLIGSNIAVRIDLLDVIGWNVPTVSVKTDRPGHEPQTSISVDPDPTSTRSDLPRPIPQTKADMPPPAQRSPTEQVDPDPGRDDTSPR